MSKQRAKGTAAETAVVRFLQDHGFPYAECPALGCQSTPIVVLVEVRPL